MFIKFIPRRDRVPDLTNYPSSCLVNQQIAVTPRSLLHTRYKLLVSNQLNQTRHRMTIILKAYAISKLKLQAIQAQANTGAVPKIPTYSTATLRKRLDFLTLKKNAERVGGAATLRSPVANHVFYFSTSLVTRSDRSVKYDEIDFF